MIETDTQDSINEIRQTLQTDLFKGSQSLATFAAEYVTDKAIYHEITVRRLKLHQAAEATEQEAFLQKFEDILDRITTNLEREVTTAALAKRSETRALLKAKTQLNNERQKSVLVTAGITKIFRKSNFSLEDVNLDIRLEEITSVVGENGNGKTNAIPNLGGGAGPGRRRDQLSTF